MIDKNQQKNIIVISGPSGVGKDTLMEIIEKRNPEKIHIAITATTRKPRSNERNGINHFFVNKDKFNQMINNDELIEWAKVYENLYGVPKSEITNNLEKNNKVLIRVDVQGAKRLKEILNQSVFIFISPESKKDLKNRLTLRHENSENDIEYRLMQSEKEITEADWFDFIVVNYPNQAEKAVLELSNIIGLN
ncbi:MAG: guanylate kinase [Dehalococcoidia bacterium]|nr:guanylate kinase [Dehalococcoidia bacterium]